MFPMFRFGITLLICSYFAIFGCPRQLERHNRPLLFGKISYLSSVLQRLSQYEKYHGCFEASSICRRASRMFQRLRQRANFVARTNGRVYVQGLWKTASPALRRFPPLNS
ncbi:hypothetical protein BU16DRAFT_247822 [Lophium mytilinum]|uniref:Secreted protein n=1 Tax=Lophium mytilinum TaxID=390894 RepID=A0A6A6R7W4_9PEZI|nr:hypothetical protein BU16DRAFT_247822 [Lophium mytilinum]